MESIEEYLKELQISDIWLDQGLKEERTALYREHLEGLRASFDGKKRDIFVPGLGGRFDRSAPGHFHPTPELFLQISGRTQFECPSAKFELGPGGVCVMPFGVPHHELFVCEKKQPYMTMIMMMWEGGVSFHFGISMKTGTGVCGITDRYRVASRPRLVQLMELISAHGVKGDQPDDYVFHLTAALLDRLIDATDRPFQGDEDSNTLVHRCRNLIAVHQDEVGFNVQALASILDYHPDYLSRLFQKDTGETLTAFLTRERIRRAKYHLTGPLTINEIAWSCGFNHTSYFIRVFKQLTGVTPKQYRLAQT